MLVSFKLTYNTDESVTQLLYDSLLEIGQSDSTGNKEEGSCLL